MKIYTKTGDHGHTGLFGGKRVSKIDPRVEAIGEIDELNSLLGICCALNKNALLKKILEKLQHELFAVGADLATPLDSRVTMKRITDPEIMQLEKWIDEIDLKVKPLQNFILPSGSLLASHLHLGRAICRRAERSTVNLKAREEINEAVLIYLNRLSDMLFIMARYANKTGKIAEKKWIK